MERLRLYRDAAGMARSEEELRALAEAIAQTVAAVADQEAGGGPASVRVLIATEGLIRLERQRRERAGVLGRPIGEEEAQDDA